MLLGRQRDIQVVDRLARRDIRRFVDRAEQRQPAIAEVVAGCAVVDETDDLIAQLAVLENLVGDEPPEVARARDQDALEPDAGAPAALEHLAHQLARRERQADVQHQEDRPDRLRHLEGARRARRRTGEVDLHVERGHDAEQHGEDGADEHGEEVVDARSAAAQPVQALEVEAERHDRGHERQQVDVLLQRRQAVRDRDEAGVEAERVGDDERRHAEQRIGDDVERHEQPVVSDHGV